ncbi:FAD-binding protein [Flammeovirga sp. MY04]|uniref:D-arabinono-1,4-lactone oxidase n=1 Tax=Flammeovirga sp. MY04 TaxID=1191459 RepID=UPI0008063A89|nr:D-arabinono-1,4-lactone oxidase [Flammeovirga sp. MY04]ANQ51768.1 FAD-binding protein [Flammeovirga sp. MY04]
MFRLDQNENQLNTLELKSNWAGNVEFNPIQVVFPSTETEIQKIVLKAANQRSTIRVIGTGHSFSALCQTNQILMSLDNYQGLVHVDKDKQQVTVKGGTKLKLLGELLWKEGLAMKNLGDIDSQSIAGTISTGTHGTGTSFGSISTQVISLKLINGKGEIKTCSLEKDVQLFKAAQVSLGALGIITEVTLQCVPTYKLLIKNRKEDLNTILSSIEERNTVNRNFEYYWFPYTETVWTKSSNIVESGEPDKDNLLNYLSELLLENYTFKGLCEFARLFPSQNKLVSKIIAQSVPTMEKLNHSHKVYATMRLVKFTEMEYSVPAEAYQEVMKEVIRLVNSEKYPIHFPIENRWVKQDDIFMSPAFGRDSAYIACHVYNKKNYKEYFKALESIFRAYDGRPHWGKLNTITQKDVTDLYPKFMEFDTVRKNEDPDGMFTNSYLKKIIG